MKITVFGATGKTGIEVVKQALEAGHTVTAFVRDPNKMTVKNEALIVTQGDVTDKASVNKAIEGSEGVVVALGAAADMQADVVMAEGTANIIESMKEYGVKRLTVMSSFGMSGEDRGMALLTKFGMDEEQISAIKPILEDKKQQTELVKTSGLDYVVVQPTMLTDTEKTGQYRAEENLEVKPGDGISRADVADFLLKSLVDGKYFGKVIVLSY